MANQKSAIINETIKLFDKNGGFLTARDIAEAVGCSHSLVFRHFNSIDELQKACFDEICHRIKQHLLRASPPKEYKEGEVESYFMEMWGLYVDYLQENPVDAHFYFSMLMRGYRYPKGYTLPTQILRSILGERYDDIVNGNPDIVFAAVYIISATNGFVQSMNNGDFDGFDDVVPRLRKLMLHGILK